ncbi:MAG: hypothetical protein COA78_25140 [Blastopirellula sp.]|nr:MAG: hypothetical protein COA78_25140 [Blastopirellula sp.]
MKDIDIARKYTAKFDNASHNGIYFDLSLTSYKNMCRAKKCKLTGITLTDKSGPNLKASDRTIDRIDATKGYVEGNCMAVCHRANQFKADFENGNRTLDVKHAEMILRFMRKHNLAN